MDRVSAIKIYYYYYYYYITIVNNLRTLISVQRGKHFINGFATNRWSQIKAGNVHISNY